MYLLLEIITVSYLSCVVNCGFIESLCIMIPSELVLYSFPFQTRTWVWKFGLWTSKSIKLMKFKGSISGIVLFVNIYFPYFHKPKMYTS